jgi:transcriptional regulator with XRE-family HTH domain
MTHGEVRRHELSDFLRTRRTRISPADIGIPTAHRRRTPGLRRKEVAQLAGMSATWYTWLEQRRAISESPGMLENLARVLQLNPVKRTQLFRLARREPVIDSAAARNGQTSRGKARQRSVPSRPHARISSPSPKCTEVKRLDGGEREIRTLGATRASSVPKDAQKWRLFCSTRLPSTQRRRSSPSVRDDSRSR